MLQYEMSKQSWMSLRCVVAVGAALLCSGVAFAQAQGKPAAKPTAPSSQPNYAPGTAAELAKVPKSDSTVSWNATALADMCQIRS